MSTYSEMNRMGGGLKLAGASYQRDKVQPRKVADDARGEGGWGGGWWSDGARCTLT